MKRGRYLASGTVWKVDSGKERKECSGWASFWPHTNLISVAGFCLFISLSTVSLSLSLAPYLHIQTFDLHYYLSEKTNSFHKFTCKPLLLSVPSCSWPAPALLMQTYLTKCGGFFRDAVSGRGGWVSGPCNSDEEPVHRQRHAHSATRRRSCQQVRIFATPRMFFSVLLLQRNCIFFHSHNHDKREVEGVYT